MKSHDQSGMSMVELMTVIGIIATVSVIAIPNLYSWLPDQRLRKAARELHSNFHLAKLTAVKTNACCTVVFNQSVDGVQYDYVVFEDSDNDLEYDDGEILLDRVLWSDYRNVAMDSSRSGGVTFAKNDDGRHATAFRPNGLPVNDGGGLGMGSVFLVNSVGKTRSVVLSSAGNVRIDE